MIPPKILYNKWYTQLKKEWSTMHRGRLKSLTWLLIGIYLSQHVHVGKIARKLPGKAQKTSKETNLIRVLNNEAIQVRPLYEPIISRVMASAVLSGQPLRLLLDGSKVGNGHQMLMVALAYRRRAFPVVWTWRKGVKGHSPVHTQIALLLAARQLIPEGAEVILTGDSEFGGCELMRRCETWGWFYALRQKGRYTLSLDEGQTWQRCDALLDQPNQTRWLTNVQLTQTHAHPCNFLAIQQSNHKQPLLLATNLPDATKTRRHYSRRMWIEEMFGDCKSNGFDIEMTRLQSPAALNRLVLCIALLVVWLLAFGSQIVKNSQRFLVDRTDRRDLSLFRIGWDSIERRLANEQPFNLRLLPYF